MGEEKNESNADTSTPCLNSQAHELCKKAKETLEKANKVLAKYGKQGCSAKPNDSEETS